MKIWVPFAVTAIAVTALAPAGASATIVVPQPINPTVITPETVSPAPAPKATPAPSSSPAPSAPAADDSASASAPQASAGGGEGGHSSGYPPAEDPAEKTPDPAAGAIRVSQLQFEIAVERALHNAGWPTAIFDGQPPVYSPPAPSPDVGMPSGDAVGALLDAIDGLFGTSLHRSLDEGTPQQEQ